MYAIYVTYNYYDGTYGAPTDGYLRDNNNKIAACADRAAVEAIAEALEPRGTYCLSHGEYSSPDYEARKIVPNPRHVSVYDAIALAELVGAEEYIEDALTVTEAK